MGYSQYWIRTKLFNAVAFEKVASDFKKMIPILKHLNVPLGDGLGENKPTISPTEIRFNGLAKCGHEKRGMGITWPAKNAKGVAKNGVSTQIQELTNSTWFAGAELESRACGGDCSHETFTLVQEYDNGFTRSDGSTYVEEPTGEYSEFTREDGTRDKTPANEVGKFFCFTKTAYKPYDLAVTVCLVIAKHHLGEDIIVRSDGDMENWHEAIQLCEKFLEYGKEFVLDEDGAVPMEMGY